eukprot:TRINITY_DN3748_c0_g1_i1.p1 TRINITY_DN3748_c0_g1~~TRINITY_DN3748_c0_g1_i1.p1  ORF type:complete len:131 (-),score=28.28 TRINITY_DN3748_c0_g1_i1:15-407(-)
MESIEDKDKTKMDLSLDIFEEMMKSEEIQKVCSILFLNKIDLFSKKIQMKHCFTEFQRIYPQYKGENNLEEATDFIKSLFVSRLPESMDQDELYVHRTCTLDTKAMNTVFEAVKDYIWKKRMEDAVHDHI